MKATPVSFLNIVAGSGGGRVGRQVPDAAESQPPAVPRPDPDAAGAVTGLVRMLAAAAPDERAHMAATLAARLPPQELAVVVDGVVGALGRTSVAATRVALADALVRVGGAAAAAVVQALLAARAADVQAQLAGILGAVGPTLPRAERVALLLDLRGLIRRLTDERALAAAVRAAAAVQNAADAELDP